MVDRVINGCKDCPFKDHENDRCSETGDIVNLRKRI